MKVATVQLNYLVGDVLGNTEKAINAIRHADAQGADVCVLTELLTTGYPPKDLLYRDDLIDLNLEAAEVIARATGELGVAVVFGYADRNPADFGKPFFNAAYVAQYGKRLSKPRYKTLLPTYDVFSEDRYFEPGPNEFEPVEITKRDGHRLLLGVVICEEGWNGPEWPKHLYRIEPVAEFVKNGAEHIAWINASPYRRGVLRTRHEMVTGHARRNNVGISYVNQTGFNDNVGFDGNSFAVNSNGEIIFHAPMFQENIGIYETDTAPIPASVYENDWQLEVLTALENGVRDYFGKQSFNGPAIIGLSGGIDSALVAYIAVRALGPERVIGIGMPSEFSSGGSVEDARGIAKKLGIKFVVEPIKNIHDEFRVAVDNINTSLASTGPRCEDSGVTDENLQARIRGIYLMAASNYHNGLVLSTGNKSEMSVGYCTLYGDMAGGLAVICDLWKTEVYEICRWINETLREEIIPWNTINKPPSAELRANQHDQQSLPPYELLDAALRLYQEQHVAPRDVRKLLVTAEAEVAYLAKHSRNLTDDINKVIRMTINAEYKRHQAPTGLKVSPKLYKDGWQMPIVHAMRT